MAELYKAKSLYVRAEAYYKRALTRLLKTLGPDHPNVGTTMNSLALLYDSIERYKEAEKYRDLALAIKEKFQLVQTVGAENINVTSAMLNLARLYHANGFIPQSEYLYKRSLTIHLETYGENNLEVAKIMEEMSDFYLKQGRQKEGNWLKNRAAQIRSAKQ
jgi:tetratricopeptide (TPR) repeat protein